MSSRKLKRQVCSSEKVNLRSKDKKKPANLLRVIPKTGKISNLRAKAPPRAIQRKRSDGPRKKAKVSSKRAVVMNKKPSLRSISKTEKNINVPTKAPPRANKRKRSNEPSKKPKVSGSGKKVKRAVLNNKKSAYSLRSISKTEKISLGTKAHPTPISRKRKRSDGPIRKKQKTQHRKAGEAEVEKKDDYNSLLALGNVAVVSNVEKFECPVCFLDVDVGEGVTLHECLHRFCKECLARAVQFSETVVVKCPFMNDDYSCECNLQEREVKSLVTPEMYERHLQRSVALAESQAENSFHCKTPDCPGWCLFEDNANTFFCPACKHTNCLTCAAIHEGKNCRQYQDDLEFMSDSNKSVKKTREHLQRMLKNGKAMRCPRCQVIIIKNYGCDALNCSMCHTDVCWITKGPRWGPGGRGDISGGCKCKINGIICHPKCRGCH